MALPNNICYLSESQRGRRYLSCIPQKDLEYGRRPQDWPEFVADHQAKSELYKIAYKDLWQFLKERIKDGSIRLYGGLKPETSLDANLGKLKHGTAARQRLRDTWDVVRFRVVTRDLSLLRDVGIDIWQAYLDEIVRCRNYYLQPKGDSNLDSYRALHFEIEIVPQRWIELQVLTEARDLVGYLDYSVSFKMLLPPVSDGHLRWLQDFSLKANIFDYQAIQSSSLRLRDANTRGF
jgi:hypothetical protein